MVNPSKKPHPPPKVKRKTPIYFFWVLENFDIVMINQSYSNYLEIYNYFSIFPSQCFQGIVHRNNWTKSLNKILFDLY